MIFLSSIAASLQLVIFLVMTLINKNSIRMWLATIAYLSILLLAAISYLFTFVLLKFIIIISICFLLYLIFYSSISIFGYKQLVSQIEPRNINKIAIIVSLHNEEQVIEETINNILNLSNPYYEIEYYFIDDSSTDGSLDILDKYEGKIKIIRSENSNPIGKASCINKLALNLECDALVIFDGDSLPEKNFLLQTIPYLEDPTVGAVQGRNIQYNKNQSIWSRLVTYDIYACSLTNYRGKNYFGTVFFEGRGAAISTKTFKELDGFTTKLRDEDLDFSFRVQTIGKHIRFSQNAINKEQATYTLKGMKTQRYRWLSNTVLSYLKNLKILYNSRQTNIAKKIDYHFVFFLSIWSAFFNFIGIIGLSSPELEPYIELFWIIYLLTGIVYYLPVLIIEKDIKLIFFMPLIYLYFWGYSIYYSIIWIEQIFLKKRPKFKKTFHSKKSFV